MTGGQYSVVRVLSGLMLVVALAQSEPRFAIPGLALTAAFIIGAGHRIAAAGLAVLLLAASPGVATTGRLLATVVLAVHAALPPKPYGTWAMRGDTDPGSTWRLPRALLVPVWGALILGAIRVHPGFATVGVLALIAPVRPLAWVALLLAYATSIVRSGAGDVPGPWMALMMTFRPEWLTATPKRGDQDEVVFYDGTCGLCHGFVRFVLSEDRAGVFRFAPLQSDTFTARVPEQTRAQLPDSIVVATADGAVLTRSAAVRYVMARLGGLWKLGATLAGLMPARLLDVAYDAVARVRHRFFKRPTEACPLMPKELRARFLY